MAKNIKEIIVGNYEFDFTNYSFRTDSRAYQDRNAYMEIPLAGDMMEIPVFALSVLLNTEGVQSIEQPQIIAANMQNMGYTFNYKSLDVNIRNALESSFSQKHLIKIPSGNNHYYLTKGLILDDRFNILMVQSWLMQRIPYKDTDDASRLKFAKPVLRVAPKVYEDRNDAMSRYIINKIIPVGALISVTHPFTSKYQLIETDLSHLYSVKVEIDDIPFRIVDTEAPSISTTNKELLDIALDHIDEFLQ